jgi:uncharacterized membrane protein YphA (DoxX/SURF4 family)
MSGDVISVLAAIVLGGAFVLAGASKLASGRAWPEMATQMGSPPIVTRVLPVIEIIVGAMLVVSLWRRVLALVALAILVVFTVQILRQLRRGQHPMCACFGAWSAKPLGATHVARNLALMALALVAATAR